MEHLAVPHHHAPVFTAEHHAFARAVHGVNFGKRTGCEFSTFIGRLDVHGARHTVITSQPEKGGPVVDHRFGLS